MLRRVWELHRSMILLGLFGLGIGIWLSSDADEFIGVVLVKGDSTLTLYKSTGAVVTIPLVEGLEAGSIIAKRSGASCCAIAESGRDEVSVVEHEELKQRYRLYWSAWTGTVEGFVMREHVDDADTALVETTDGTTVRWKVWESDLAGLKRGEKLCKEARSWSPRRCNPEAGVVEFNADIP